MEIRPPPARTKIGALACYDMAGGIAAIWVALFVFLAGFHTTSSRSFVVDWKNDVFLKDGERRAISLHFW